MVNDRNCKVRVVGRFLLRNILAVGDILWAYFCSGLFKRHFLSVLCFVSPCCVYKGLLDCIASRSGCGDTWAKMLTVCVDLAFPGLWVYRRWVRENVLSSSVGGAFICCF